MLILLIALRGVSINTTYNVHTYNKDVIVNAVITACCVQAKLQNMRLKSEKKPKKSCCYKSPETKQFLSKRNISEILIYSLGVKFGIETPTASTLLW